MSRRLQLVEQHHRRLRWTQWAAVALALAVAGVVWCPSSRGQDCPGAAITEACGVPALSPGDPCAMARTWSWCTPDPTPPALTWVPDPPDPVLGFRLYGRVDGDRNPDGSPRYLLLAELPCYWDRYGPPEDPTWVWRCPGDRVTGGGGVPFLRYMDPFPMPTPVAFCVSAYTARAEAACGQHVDWIWPAHQPVLVIGPEG